MNDTRFKALAENMCRHYGKSVVKIGIGEPYPKQKLLLVYSKKEKEFSIEWEDGVKLSQKLTRRLMPNALGVLLMVVQSLEKKYERERKQQQKNRL